MKALRRILISLGALLAVLAAGVAILIATLDTDALKPRIEAAVEQATGRRLTLAGPIHFSPSLVPTIVAENVSFANIEGGSRPTMVRLARLELRLALLPLLSQQVDIRRLLLVEPDILLEADAQGRPNWVFSASPRTPAAPPAGAPPSPPSPRAGSRIGFGEILIEGGRISWRSIVTGHAETARIERLSILATSEAEPVRLDGRFVLAGRAFGLRGETAHFVAAGTDRPWPFRFDLTGEGMEAHAEGALARAGAVQDWQARVQARVAALQSLQPIADLVRSGLALPPAQDVQVDAAFAMQGGVFRPGAFTLGVGATELGALREGLSVTRLEIAAPALDQPVRVTGEGRLGNAPLSIAGTLGAPAAFLPGAAPTPFPLDITVEAAGARATLAGRIADPARFGGAAIDITLRVPDMPALAALAGRPLPALGAFEAQARLTTEAAGMAGPLRFSALRVVAPAMALGGELELEGAPRLSLRGQLSGPRVDLDALLAAFAPLASPPASAPAPAAPATVAPVPAGPRRVIPATPLRFDALRLFDAELRFAIAELHAQGITYLDVAGSLALAEGRARLEPFAVTLPGGRIAGALAVDASTEAPTLHATLRNEGEGIALAPLLAAYRLPAYASGRMELALSLSGQGADLRALLGSADGRLALAMQGGQIEPALLNTIPGNLRGLILPPGAEGGVALRCLALVAPARAGVVQAETLLLDSAIGRLGGSGTVRLHDEVVALRLMPDIRVGPVQLRAPVRVGGTLAQPNFAAPDNAGAAIGAGLGAILGMQRTPDRGLQDLAQSLGGGGPALPDCATALAAAREGAGSVTAAPTTPTATAPAPPAPAPAPAPRSGGNERVRIGPDLLRGLFGGRR